jgi:hypothetical protein
MAAKSRLLVVFTLINFEVWLTNHKFNSKI